MALETCANCRCYLPNDPKAGPGGVCRRYPPIPLMANWASQDAQVLTVVAAGQTPKNPRIYSVQNITGAYPPQQAENWCAEWSEATASNTFTTRAFGPEGEEIQ